MPSKINPTTDLQIYELLAQGITNKEIASILGVSPSYVSKIKTGKKIPYIHIAQPSIIKDEFFEFYNTDMDELLLYLSNKKLIVADSDIVEYLIVQMKKAMVRAKMYQEILRRIKNG